MLCYLTTDSSRFFAKETKTISSCSNARTTILSTRDTPLFFHFVASCKQRVEVFQNHFRDRETDEAVWVQGLLSKVTSVKNWLPIDYISFLVFRHLRHSPPENEIYDASHWNSAWKNWDYLRSYPWSICGLVIHFQSLLWHHPWLKRDWIRSSPGDMVTVLWLKFNPTLT